MLLGFEWWYRLNSECRSHLACRELRMKLNPKAVKLERKRGKESAIRYTRSLNKRVAFVSLRGSSDRSEREQRERRLESRRNSKGDLL